MAPLSWEAEKVRKVVPLCKIAEKHGGVPHTPKKVLIIRKCKYHTFHKLWRDYLGEKQLYSYLYLPTFQTFNHGCNSLFELQICYNLDLTLSTHSLLRHNSPFLQFQSGSRQVFNGMIFTEYFMNYLPCTTPALIHANKVHSA